MGKARGRRLLGFATGDANEPGWGAGGVTVVGAVYKGATFSARIQTSDVLKALRDVSDSIARYKANRTAYLDAKDHIVTALKKDEHLTEDGRLHHGPYFAVVLL
jgi:hypothetical protein